MNFTQFNFAHPAYLWAFLLAPLALILFSLGIKTSRKRKLDAFADAELLPHLLSKTNQYSRPSRFLMAWTTIWALGVLALAGPRWNFVMVPTYQPAKDLVVLLDLSPSMEKTDVKPSRLARAKERIADLINENRDVKVGLVAFAGDAHMVAPLTEDQATLNHLLPALRTDLVAVQGRDYAAAIRLAASMFPVDTRAKKAIVVMSDGPMTPSSIGSSQRQMRERGITLETMDFNNSAGESIDPRRLFGSDVLSAQAEAGDSFGRDWEPRFYIFLIPALAVLLFMFRKVDTTTKKSGSSRFVAIALLLLTGLNARAESKAVDLFLNKDLQGARALKARDYAGAEAKFSDPYRKGIAQYRAGDYAAAARSFKESKRPEVSVDSTYNLGNALAQQAQYAAAASAYKQALKERPDFENAKKNLKIVEDLMKNPPPQSSDQKNQSTAGVKDEKNDKDKKDDQGGSGKENRQADQKSTKSTDQVQAQAGKSGSPSSESKPGPKNDSDSNSRTDANTGKDGERKSADASGSSGQLNLNQQKQNEASNRSAPTGGQPDQNSTGDALAKKTDKDNGQTPKLGSSESEARPMPNRKTAKEYARDADADQWLSLVRNDPHAFLKNQFMIESARKRANAQNEEPEQ